jgi:hypothetical protein
MITDFTAYIDNLQGVSVNINKIHFDYEVLQDKMVDVTTHDNKVLVQKKFHLMWQDQFCAESELVPYTVGIVNFLKERVNFNSATYRCVMPNTAYNWHQDTGGLCYHIPIITNPGCWFVYENRNFHMKADGTVYKVNSKRYHTFVNAGPNPRIHLTFEIL